MNVYTNLEIGFIRIRETRATGTAIPVTRVLIDRSFTRSVN